MIGRYLSHSILVAGAVAFVLVLVLPAIALIFQLAANWGVGSEWLWPSARQWGLLLKTVVLGAMASASALLLSLPGAYVVGRIGKVANAPLLACLLILPLMLPPMVYAFGWERLLGGQWSRQWSPLARCVWVWASWAWPIPALILGAGWSRLGRDAYEAALLVTSAPSAFCRIVLPVLSRHVFISLLILFAVFCGEYSVPHSQGVFVIASDLLDTASYGERSRAVVEIVRGTAPSVGVILVLACLLRRWRRGFLPGVGLGGRIEPSRPSIRLTAVVTLIVVVTSILPVAVIAWRRTLLSDLVEAVATYSPELLGSLGVCVGAGVVAVLIGLGVMNAPRFRAPAIALSIVCGLAPGAVVGQAVLAAYQPVGRLHALPVVASVCEWVYNHWAIVVIGLSARFAWVGVFLAWLARASIPRPLLEQARLDGLAGRSGEIGLQVGYQWPALLSGVFLAGALSMAELAVVSMVQVPYPNMVAMILVEKFHRFETGMLASLSLLLVASVLPGAILMVVALRRRERSCVQRG